MTNTALTRPEKLAGVLLGGPACGLEIETQNGGPEVELVGCVLGERTHVEAYAWLGASEPSTGRWIWKHLQHVGTKGAPKS
jgi:hypothetical protein